MVLLRWEILSACEFSQGAVAGFMSSASSARCQDANVVMSSFLLWSCSVRKLSLSGWDIEADSWRIPKGAFVCWTTQTAEMCCRTGLVISREQGFRYVTGFAVPVLMS